jgi:phosphatidylethanolamine/phosphatidyl-N-methylethanolamine N-methyltransferase
MLRQLRDRAAFVTQFRKQFETTGSITPSSRFLAQSMTRFLAERDPSLPLRVLEIGPGTGPVTDRIVQFLQPHDTFDLVELNESFADILRNKFATEQHWKRVAGNSTVHQVPLQEFAADQTYHFVISGLPMVNFPVDVVKSLLAAYARLLKPGGVLSYFEYMYMRPLRKLVSGSTERQRVTDIGNLMEHEREKRGIARDNVFINFPPAWVVHLQADTTADSAGTGSQQQY